MDKYPVVVYIGAGILGKVAGDMMITDPYIQRLFHTSHLVDYLVQAIFAVGVIMAGKLFLKLKTQRTALQQGYNDTVDILGVFSK